MIHSYFEAEYNNRTKVPEYPAILAGWVRDAAAFRDGHANAELTLAYGPTPRQVMDVFWPGAGRDAPLALFIHGGYWQFLDASVFSHFARGLLAHGIAVALPTYDLCPHVSMAALVEEVREAAAFLHRRTGRRLLAVGHSAGGHLAAMLLATDWPGRGLPPGPLAGAVLLSGVYDLEPIRLSYVDEPLRLSPDDARRNSPIRLAPGSSCPVVVSWGEHETDEFKRQSREYARFRAGAGRPCVAFEQPGRNHFDAPYDLLEEDSRRSRETRELLGV
jgi:arylformamidase